MDTFCPTLNPDAQPSACPGLGHRSMSSHEDEPLIKARPAPVLAKVSSVGPGPHPDLALAWLPSPSETPPSMELVLSSTQSTPQGREGKACPFPSSRCSSSRASRATVGGRGEQADLGWPGLIVCCPGVQSPLSLPQRRCSYQRRVERGRGGYLKLALFLHFWDLGPLSKRGAEVNPQNQRTREPGAAAGFPSPQASLWGGGHLLHIPQNPRCHATQAWSWA